MTNRFGPPLLSCPSSFLHPISPPLASRASIGRKAEAVSERVLALGRREGAAEGRGRIPEGAPPRGSAAGGMMVAPGQPNLATGRMAFPQVKRRSSSVETRSAVSSARKKLRFEAPAPPPSSRPASSSSPASTLRGISALPREAKIISIPPSDMELHTSAQVSRARRVRKKPVRLPGLEVRASQVPMGGLGVYATSDIPRGAIVTEYGGEVIDHDEASRRRGVGQDTHIRSLGRTECLDSRVRGEWDVPYYCRHHMLGGFLNDAHGTLLTTNCEYAPVDCGDEGYQHPYEGGPWVSKRVWIKTKREVARGEELFVSYGSTYHTIHF